MTKEEFVALKVTAITEEQIKQALSTLSPEDLADARNFARESAINAGLKEVDVKDIIPTSFEGHPIGSFIYSNYTEGGFGEYIGTANGLPVFKGKNTGTLYVLSKDSLTHIRFENKRIGTL